MLCDQDFSYFFMYVRLDVADDEEVRPKMFLAVASVTLVYAKVEKSKIIK